MMYLTQLLPAIRALALALLATLCCVQHSKACASDRFYGVGQPHSTSDLPTGELKSALKKLPPSAQAEALGQLQNISFSAEDTAHLKVDSEGSILYADAVEPSPEASSQAEVPTSSLAVDPAKIFKLHSRPGSSNVMFLDFDGHDLEGTAWNVNRASVLKALPFDPYGNDNPSTVANFHQSELNRIAEIWHRIASDFAVFDIDVTTEEPDVFTNTTAHILFTHDKDANGNSMPWINAPGAAYADVFGSSDYVSYYSPALVYYTNLYEYAQGYAPPIAEAASHYFGHQLGLGHDGRVSAGDQYQGHGIGKVSWAPIMGWAYGKNVTQWSQGEYPSASNPENDLAIIAGHLGYIGDDHADSSAQATALAVDADGMILSSSPELDPDNVLTENKGIIGDRDDVDWFYVDVTGSGTLEITATPSWHAFTRSSERGENLDLELLLFNSSLTLIAADEPEDETNATVTATVNPGRYYLQLDGVGNNSNSDYSDYASIGMYFIEGSVPMGNSQPNQVFSSSFE